MSGQIDETNYTSVKEKHLSPQSEIADFCHAEETTYIAVVSMPRRGIEKYVDEVCPELGMPEWALSRFLERRAGYRGNSAVELPHEKAYEDENLHGIYQNHLTTEKAQRKISDFTERLLSGENITLVCYEEGGKSCHRHILVDVLEDRVERRENSKFKLRA